LFYKVAPASDQRSSLCGLKANEERKMLALELAGLSDQSLVQSGQNRTVRADRLTALILELDHAAHETAERHAGHVSVL
jgi:hypothetical protein